MQISPLSRSYFSPDPGKEIFFRRLVAFITILLYLVMLIHWEETRSIEFINTLYQTVIGNPFEYFFRAITFIGDDEGHMFLIMLIYWCIHKSIGFMTIVVLLSSSVYVYILKEITALPRPVIEGINHPESMAFPSGHTLSVTTVWGYLATRVNRRFFWFVALLIILLVGTSRMFLGYHFFGDIIGGAFFGIIFLAVFLKIIANQKSSIKFLSISPLAKCGLLVIVFTILFLGSKLIFGDAGDPPKALGIILGLWIGHLLEKEYLRFIPSGAWYQHVLKIIIGFVGMLTLAYSYRYFMPVELHSSVYLSYIRYASAGFWAIYLAPLVFIKLGLMEKEILNITE